MMKVNGRDDKALGWIIQVWTKNNWPPENHQTFQEFYISPRQAYRAVAKSRRLSLKHHWVCYRDDKFYYIADTFGKNIDASNVVKYGLKINGVTGLIEN
jgi:hypothetical protein